MKKSNLLFKQLDQIESVKISLDRTLEWENLGGKHPDYAVTKDAGKANTFGYYLYTATIHTAFTKDRIIETSKYSWEEAIENAIKRWDNR